jgi:hypothetical protein
LKNINTPNFGSVFRHTALKCLAIHKVLLRHFALSDEKCPLIGHIAVLQTAPSKNITPCNADGESPQIFRALHKLRGLLFFTQLGAITEPQ